METKLTIPITTIAHTEYTTGVSIGGGGYGHVYRGTWFGMEVAIKKLHLPLLAGELSTEFKQEASVMAQCRHPHVVGLLGVCVDPGHVGLVMEYLAKGSLYQVLQDPKEAFHWNPMRWTIAIDMGKGLHYLHSRNIVHRDLKSLNILLDAHYHAKIADFGLSKIKTASSAASTTPHRGIGSVRWRAPELCKRGGKPDFKSDLYSYGMILWEISTRRLPYDDETDDQMVISFIKDGEKETIPPDCPEVYRLVIESCWKTNPADRPSAGVVVGQLEVAQAALPPPVALPPLWRSVSGLRKCWQLDEETERQVQAEVLQQQGYQRIPASNAEREKVKQWIYTNPVTAQPYPDGFMPFEGYEMGRIEAIYNPSFYRGFEAHLEKLQRRQENPVFQATWQSDPNELPLREEVDKVREKLTVHYPDPDYPAVQLLPAFHATKHSALEGICQGGYAALGTTDSGYFGRGYYSTPHAEYAHRVYGEKGVQSYVLLNWVGWYSALPVIKADKLEGKGAFKHYDAHFVPVGNAEFEKVKKYDAYDEDTWANSFTQGDPPQYVEVVTFDSASCFPAYCIELNQKPVAPQNSSHTPPSATPAEVSSGGVNRSKTTTPLAPIFSNTGVSFTPPVTTPPVILPEQTARVIASGTPVKLAPSPSSPPKGFFTGLFANVFNSQTLTPSVISPPPQTPSKSDTYSPTVFKPSPSPTPKKELSYPEQVEGMSEAAKKQNPIQQAEVEALLKWVTEGHLVEVELLLKKNPSVGLCTGTVTDRSDRTFKGITALQYAAWCLDEEMCDLLMRYIGAHNSKIQLKALYDNPSQYSEHGEHYDIKPLIQKTKTYIEKYDEWNYEKCCQYWQKEVGGEQRKCPAWLIYAWSEEGYDVAWTKQDFSRKIKREYEKHRLEWWFTESYNNGRGVGSEWGVVRGGRPACVSGYPLVRSIRLCCDAESQEKLGVRGGEFLVKLKSLSENLKTAEITTTQGKKQ